MRNTRAAYRLVLHAQMLAIALTALTAITATSAMAQTVVEKRLAALQPCSSLKTTQELMGRPITLAIDKLIDVTLTSATVSMAGDNVTVSFAGGVSCKTSEQSAIKGDASVDLTASAVGNLADCSIRSLSITPTRFGGSLAEVVKGTWEPLIRPKLEADAREMLIDACTRFVTGK